jgi:hypothetical protein
MCAQMPREFLQYVLSEQARTLPHSHAMHFNRLGDQCENKLLKISSTLILPLTCIFLYSFD